MISLPFAAGDAASAVYAARPKYAAHCAELLFIIIQLPQWIDRATAEAHADPLDWPVIRDAQWAASREIPSVATVCTIDCGEFDNIHPYDKRTVGERTAAMALGTMYRCREIAVWGPEPLAIRAVDGSADYSADGCAGGCAGGGDGSDGSSDDSERGGAVLVRYRHAAGLRFDGTVCPARRTPTDWMRCLVRLSNPDSSSPAPTVSSMMLPRESCLIVQYTVGRPVSSASRVRRIARRAARRVTRPAKATA